MNLVNIALSGMNANRVALDVTAQNVANINTPGYSPSAGYDGVHCWGQVQRD